MAEPAKKAEPAKAEPAKAELAKAEPAKVEPERPEPTTAAPDAAGVAGEAAAPDPNADVVLDDGKEFYGLKVPDIDGWKASFEVDRGGIEWTKRGHVGVTMGLHDKPIDKVEDIEIGFMAGTELSKQDPPTKTASGWYTTVVTKDRGTVGFIYVRRIGKSWLVCDTLLSRTEGDARPKHAIEKIVEICDSATV